MDDNYKLSGEKIISFQERQRIDFGTENPKYWKIIADQLQRSNCSKSKVKKKTTMYQNRSGFSVKK